MSAPTQMLSLGATRQQRVNARMPGLRQQNAYRGLQYDPARMPVASTMRSVDQDFLGQRRQLAWNSSTDLLQNLNIIGWMMRQHLAYTSLFTYAPRTADITYNREMREWYRLRTSKKRLDVQRRFTLEDMILTYANLKVLHGYAAMLKVKGGKLQLFEAWNIARGDGIQDDERRYGVTVNKDGVVLDENGAVDYVALATGNSTGNQQHRYLAHHSEIILDGFTERAAGTLWESPLMSVLTKARDYLDADEFQLIKAKLHSMFVVLRLLKPETEGGAGFPTRQGTYGLPTGGVDQPADEGLASEAAQQQIAQPAPPPLSEIRTGTMITGEHGDDVKFLESRTPSHEYLAFTQKLCADLLSVLDIPLTFYYSNLGTYSSLKADSVRYSQSLTVRQQRRANADAMREAIVHLMRDGIAKRDMPLWRGGGYTVESFPFALIGRAPWILDPSKELPAMLSRLGAGLSDFEMVCDELGTGDFYDIIDRQAAQRTYAKDRGVLLNTGDVKIKLDGHDMEPQPTNPTPPAFYGYVPDTEED